MVSFLKHTPTGEGRDEEQEEGGEEEQVEWLVGESGRVQFFSKVTGAVLSFIKHTPDVEERRGEEGGEGEWLFGESGRVQVFSRAIGTETGTEVPFLKHTPGAVEDGEGRVEGGKEEDGE